MRPKLLTWQFDGYPQFHASRENLVLHLIGVPMFIAGLATVIAGAFFDWRISIAGLASMVIGFGAQARGHRGEAIPSIPFEGPLDAISRIFVEQLITFPRFFFNGGVSRAWRRQEITKAD